MKYLVILAGVCFLFVLWSCKSSETLLEKYKGQSISVGTAGGISGGTEGFRVEPDGSVYKFYRRLQKKDENKIFKAPLDSVRIFFSLLDEMKFPETQYDSAANVTNFLELRSDTLIHKMRWSPSDTTAPVKARQLFVKMLQFVESNTPKISK